MLKLSSPYIPASAIEKITNILRSGNLVEGEYAEKFEDALKHYLNVEHVILVSSGTASLHLSLIALEIKEGDEVIIPAFTFPATANVVEFVGARPVLVDISLDDFCLNIEKIEEAITEKTKAIIPVHEFGQAAEITKIVELSKKYHLELIEDAACSLGTEYSSRKVGTFGIMGCFSFHPRKIITTGEGGAIITNDRTLARKLRSLKNHGIFMKETENDFFYPGLNYRLTDFQAALGLYQLGEIERTINERINIAEEYNKLLSLKRWARKPKVYPDRKHVFQTYHVILENNINRESLINTLKAVGIETNLGAQAVHCLSYYKKKYGFSNSSFPNAYIAFKQGLALPTGSHVKSRDAQYVIRAIDDIIKQRENIIKNEV